METKRMATENLISSLPSTFIETILCSLPIRDAVRTSILSRNWRYNWTTIPKLVFDLRDTYSNPNEMTRKSKVWAIHQVLLLHQGPLLEFTLSMCVYKHDKCVEIDQIILHLSRKNTIKKFTLHFSWNSLYKLPLSVFSFHQLTDLSLCWCVLEFSPTFSGFGNLTSLSLIDVKTSAETLVHLLSNCPLLARLSLDYGCPEYAEDGLCVDLNELVKCLPVIEHLSVSPWALECNATGELPTILFSLKSLCMLEMSFDNKVEVLYLFLLIKSSPNLEKIQIKQRTVDGVDDPGPVRNSLEDHSDIWLKHLIELEIQHFTTLEIDMAFVKLILTKSPILKKVRIMLADWVEDDEELKMLRILLRFPRASPTAEIIVRREE